MDERDNPNLNVQTLSERLSPACLLFPKSGRSDHGNMGKLRVRFRPLADMDIYLRFAVARRVEAFRDKVLVMQASQAKVRGRTTRISGSTPLFHDQKLLTLFGFVQTILGAFCGFAQCLIDRFSFLVPFGR